MTRLPVYAIVALVALRLVCGWHFFNEGIKKLDPTFSSAGFLRTAKGPLAPTFAAMVPGPHGAYGELMKPVRIGSRDDETQQAIDAWVADYGKRSAQAAKAGEPLPADIPAEVPGAAWVEQIAASWDEGLVRLGRLGAEGDVAEELSALRDAKLGEIVNYLHVEQDGIQDLQHEAWRLEQLKEKVGDSPAPFQRELVDEQQGVVWKTIQPWLASVGLIEQTFFEDAGEVATEIGLSPGRVASSLEERNLLDWVDWLVMLVVLGSGVCVFLGLGTRVAAVLAAGFLFSLILTQPPGAYGVDISFFFTWAIELCAFLVLAATGAGQWAGLDGLLHQTRLRFGDLSPAFQGTRAPADQPAGA